MREEEGLHPVAILAGILILLVVILLITTSAFQRERLHYMASHLIRKKWRDHKGQEESPVITDDMPMFLKTAAETGNTRIIRRYIHSTAPDLNARDADNLTLLHVSARNGHSDVIKLLLNANADANVHDNRKVTPLHLAAMNGHALCVKLLLEHHADPFRKDIMHQTAREIAEKSGNIGCARLLQRSMAQMTLNQEEKSGSASLTLRAGIARVDSAV